MGKLPFSTGPFSIAVEQITIKIIGFMVLATALRAFGWRFMMFHGSVHLRDASLSEPATLWSFVTAIEEFLFIVNLPIQHGHVKHGWLNSINYHSHCLPVPIFQNPLFHYPVHGDVLQLFIHWSGGPIWGFNKNLRGRSLTLFANIQGSPFTV